MVIKLIYYVAQSLKFAGSANLKLFHRPQYITTTYGRGFLSGTKKLYPII